MENVAAALNLAGASLVDVVKTTVIVATAGKSGTSDEPKC